MRIPLLLAGAACLASAFVIGPRPGDRAAMGRLQRLAGPLGSVAASTQWMRFTLATRSGDGERALGVGRSALGMDLLAPDGWQLLARLGLVADRTDDDDDDDDEANACLFTKCCLADVREAAGHARS